MIIKIKIRKIMIIIGYNNGKNISVNEDFACKFYYIKVFVKLWNILTIID